MQILVAGRRTGKSTESVMQCLELGLHLVVPTRTDVKRLEHQYPDIRGRIVTWYDFTQDRVRGRCISGVVIDDLERCLSMHGVAVHMVAATAQLCGRDTNSDNLHRQ